MAKHPFQQFDSTAVPPEAGHRPFRPGSPQQKGPPQGASLPMDGPVPPGGARGLPGRRKGAGGRERLYPPRGTGKNRPGARGPGPAFPAYRIGIKLLPQITSSLGFSAHQDTTAPSRCQAPGPGSFCRKIIIQKKTREKERITEDSEGYAPDPQGLFSGFPAPNRPKTARERPCVPKRPMVH